MQLFELASHSWQSPDCRNAETIRPCEPRAASTSEEAFPCWEATVCRAGFSSTFEGGKKAAGKLADFFFFRFFQEGKLTPVQSVVLLRTMRTRDVMKRERERAGRREKGKKCKCGINYPPSQSQQLYNVEGRAVRKWGKVSVIVYKNLQSSCKEKPFLNAGLSPLCVGVSPMHWWSGPAHFDTRWGLRKVLPRWETKHGISGWFLRLARRMKSAKTLQRFLLFFTARLAQIFNPSDGQWN